MRTLIWLKGISDYSAFGDYFLGSFYRMCEYMQVVEGGRGWKI